MMVLQGPSDPSAAALPHAPTVIPTVIPTETAPRELPSPSLSTAVPGEVVNWIHSAFRKWFSEHSCHQTTAAEPEQMHSGEIR